MRIANVGEKNHSFPPISHARAEWALRWLLEKMKSDGTDGQQLRALPKTWTTLERLIDSIPESNAAKILTASGFLNSLKKTLDEQLANGRTDIPSPVFSRKRKRSQNSSVDSLSNVFSALRAVLGKLLEKANSLESHGDAIASSRLRAVLRMDAESASNLMSSWARAVRIQLLAHAGTAENLMYPVMDIWKLRSIPETDEFGTSSAEFSRNCLVHVSLLYSTCLGVQRGGGRTGRRYFSVQWTRALWTLSILLMHHVIGPARSSYFSAQKQIPRIKEDAIQDNPAAHQGRD